MEKQYGASLGHNYKGKAQKPVIESPKVSEKVLEVKKPAPKQPVFEQKGDNKKYGK
jgi:hypothetical protein